MPWMTFLTPWLAAFRPAQTARPGLGQPVTAWRLAAVAALLRHLVFQLLDALIQFIETILQQQHQIDKRALIQLL